MSSDTLPPDEVVIEPHPYPEAVGMSEGCFPAGVKATHRPTGASVIVTHFPTQDENVDVAVSALKVAVRGGMVIYGNPRQASLRNPIPSGSFKYSEDEVGGFGGPSCDTRLPDVDCRVTAMQAAKMLQTTEDRLRRIHSDFHHQESLRRQIAQTAREIQMRVYKELLDTLAIDPDFLKP
jgi:hypothetical protein